MLDKERILSKISELKGYLEKLKTIVPASFQEYQESEVERRACERLLQISIECVLDICDIIFSGLKLGVPSSEEDVIEKLRRAKVISEGMSKKLKGMKGMRNVLVHRYPYIDDEKVFEVLTEELDDFYAFIDEILKFLKKVR